MSEGPYTYALAGYIAGSRFEHLPKPIVEHVKLLVLDTLGVGLYGTTLPWSQRLLATADTMEAPGRVSVWGTRSRFSAPIPQARSSCDFQRGAGRLDRSVR